MKKHMLLPFVSIFFWSTVATVSKLLLTSYNNFQVLWISSFFAGCVLLIVNLFNGNVKQLKKYRAKDFVISILIGLPGTLFYYVFYYAGTAVLPASQAFILNYVWPIMSVIFAWIILKEKMTVWKAVGILTSFLGIVVVMGKELFVFNDALVLGGACCLLGAACYGLFTALNQRFYYNKGVSMMLNCFTTFIITTVINGFGGDLFIPAPLEALGFAWNGMLCMAVATTVWALALESGETAKISNLAYITPFLSLIWTSLILDEPLNEYFIIGLILIVCGVLIQFGKTKDKIKK